MNRIKQLRLERGRTQSEIADYLGTTKQNISYYERMDKMPPADICQRLADFFLV